MMKVKTHIICGSDAHETSPAPVSASLPTGPIRADRETSDSKR